MLKHPCVRDMVVFHDGEGTPHPAFVTAYFGQVLEDGSYVDSIGCANLVFVSDIESKHDDYGRQIERVTSIAHKSSWHVHGNYWRWPDEDPLPYTPPTSV